MGPFSSIKDLGEKAVSENTRNNQYNCYMLTYMLSIPCSPSEFSYSSTLLYPYCGNLNAGNVGVLPPQRGEGKL
jgi:hypothetical protein